MAYEDRHDVVFQELFKNNPAGLALYKPFSSTKLKPGACGYFDYDGDWQTITDLTDPAVLEAGGWTRAIVETEPTQMEEYWPAMVSKGVEAFSGSIDVNVAYVNLRDRPYAANAFQREKTNHKSIQWAWSWGWG
jgi:hypothetical protein